MRINRPTVTNINRVAQCHCHETTTITLTRTVNHNHPGSAHTHRRLRSVRRPGHHNRDNRRLNTTTLATNEHSPEINRTPGQTTTRLAITIHQGTFATSVTAVMVAMLTVGQHISFVTIVLEGVMYSTFADLHASLIHPNRVTPTRVIQ